MLWSVMTMILWYPSEAGNTIVCLMFWNCYTQIFKNCLLLNWTNKPWTNGCIDTSSNNQLIQTDRYQMFNIWFRILTIWRRDIIVQCLYNHLFILMRIHFFKIPHKFWNIRFRIPRILVFFKKMFPRYHGYICIMHVWGSNLHCVTSWKKRGFIVNSAESYILNATYFNMHNQRAFFSIFLNLLRRLFQNFNLKEIFLSIGSSLLFKHN